jgi:pyruvate/2-oxoglutarate dehydrogenase complex dihydrolipoamide acyltransferase (E2) component
VLDMTDIFVAKQGMGMTEATLAEWKVPVGSLVQKGQVVASIETDKVHLDVEAPATGRLVEQLVVADQDFEVPAVIGRIETTGVTPHHAG